MSSVEEICDNITLINNSQTILSGTINGVKQTYKDNLVQLDFAGASDALKNVLNHSFNIKTISDHHNHQVATIQLSKGQTINHLLQNVINQVEIHGIKEILPSMNDIFIKVVEQSNSNKANNN